nr:MAG TPA: hypothetical protein [Bacteriophage sp.]DAI95335.1 MAG TPA: hypothetical protein [Caudoviricetes sp.]
MDHCRAVVGPQPDPYKEGYHRTEPGSNEIEGERK